MKKNSPFWGIGSLAVVLVSNVSAEERVSGLIPDDPREVSKVPMVVSPNGLSRGQKKKFDIAGAGASSTTSTTSGRGKTKTDRSPPTVILNNPVNGAALSGIVDIVASATDNVGLRSVTFAIDGRAVASFTAGPFRFAWDTNAYSAGTHVVMVSAIDTSGNSASQSVTVTANSPVVLDTTPPSVNILSPSNGASVIDTISVQVGATDNLGVSAVEFIVDSRLVATKSVAPYTFSWNASGAGEGTHVLAARARDAAGNATTTEITVAVNAPIVVLPPPPADSATAVILNAPTPGNQGAEGSCVGFAAASMRSIEHHYRTGASGFSESSNVFSPEYLYNQIKFSSDCSSGSAMQTALDFIKNRGISTWATMPYSGTNGCALLPNATQEAEAGNYKITGYVKMLSTDRAAIKSMIQAKHPVLISVIADNSFISAKAGFVWKTYSGSGSLAHALLIVGYDDSKNAYKIMNSWGTAWGDGGFTYIDYDFFLTRTGTYVYAME